MTLFTHTQKFDTDMIMVMHGLIGVVAVVVLVTGRSSMCVCAFVCVRLWLPARRLRLAAAGSAPVAAGSAPVAANSEADVHPIGSSALAPRIWSNVGAQVWPSFLRQHDQSCFQSLRRRVFL